MFKRNINIIFRTSFVLHFNILSLLFHLYIILLSPCFPRDGLIDFHETFRTDLSVVFFFSFTFIPMSDLLISISMLVQKDDKKLLGMKTCKM